MTAFAAVRSVLCSPVCLGIIAKYGHFPGISDEEEPIFSAVQTAWRRERDSNPRYRSEWRKSRRLRKLRGISWFEILQQTACSPFDTLNSRFRETSRGEAPAIVWLKVVSADASQAAKWART